MRQGLWPSACRHLCTRRFLCGNLKQRSVEGFFYYSLLIIGYLSRNHYFCH
nr:MAG TPA: hypothetical protein [Caudoviricetes sp.]